MFGFNIIKYRHQTYVTEVKGTTQRNPQLYNLRLTKKKKKQTIQSQSLKGKKKLQICSHKSNVKQQEKLRKLYTIRESGITKIMALYILILIKSTVETLAN